MYFVIWVLWKLDIIFLSVGVKLLNFRVLYLLFKYCMGLSFYYWIFLECVLLGRCFSKNECFSMVDLEFESWWFLEFWFINEVGLVFGRVEVIVIFDEEYWNFCVFFDCKFIY